MTKNTSQNRATWNSQIGFLLAAVGSAVGLGNIWRFSYMTFKFGGGAFLVPYFVALILAGIPLMILEYGLGHREQGASPLSFSRVSTNWEWAGWWMPMSAMFGIMLYYAVVIGYCLIYLFLSINLTWGTDTQAFFFNSLLHVSDSPLHFGGIQVSIISATLLVWTLCWIICYNEVNRGIELACKIFIPLLFLLTLVLVGWGLTLPGAIQGIKAYLVPDWQKLKDFNVWTAAFGQTFFSLSLGFGIMITYASYLPRRTNICTNALITSSVDCIFSFITGFAVFSVIGFMAMDKGMPITGVVKSGPQLAFIVFPEAINNLPFLRNIFGICFFSVLFLAGISSGISLVEAFSCALCDKFSWNRKKVVSALCLLGFLGSVIFTTQAGLYLIDIVDHFITNYALILGGIIECYIVGWLFKAKLLRKHVNIAMGASRFKVKPWWDVCIRYLTPAALLIIMIQSLIQELKTPYEGYPLEAIILFGVDWLILVLIVSVVFTFYPWKSELLHRKHLPEEDHLLV